MTRFIRTIAATLLVAGTALLPALNTTTASAQDKMMHGKMSGGKMSGSKMMHGKMSGGKMMMSSSDKMMMGHMTASEKRTYSHMSASEKALMMKMMHGKM